MTTTRPFDAAVPAQPASDNAPASFRKSLRFMIASFLLRREVPGKQVDLRVGIALGDLVHYGGRALAFLEGLHLRHQELLRLPGERGDLPGRAAPIGAVAVGAGGSQAACDRVVLRVDGERGQCKHRPKCDSRNHLGSSQRATPKSRGQATDAVSSSNFSLIFSSSPTSMLTLPPCWSRPKSSSSASARRIVSWMSRAMGRAPISGSKPFFARCSFRPWLNCASTFFSASCSSSCIRNLSTTRMMISWLSARNEMIASRRLRNSGGNIRLIVSISSPGCTEGVKPIWAFASDTEPAFVVMTMHTLRKSAFLPLLRSEEHTSELQSRLHLVCRLLLE